MLFYINYIFQLLMKCYTQLLFKKIYFGHQLSNSIINKIILREDCCFRKRLTKTKERIVKTIQLFSATTLQQINEKKKKKE